VLFIGDAEKPRVSDILKRVDGLTVLTVSDIDRFCDIALAFRGSRRVLDVGSGNGLLAALLAMLGHEVCAVDFFDRRTEDIYARHRIAFAVCNVEADPLPFEPASLDAVSCCQALEHFTHSHLPAVLEMKRILGPGGIIMAELKRRRGAKHTDEQKRWFDLAARAAADFDRPGNPRFIVALWTFDNWPDEIYKAINSIAAPPSVHAVVVVNGPPSTIRDFGPDAPGMAMAREAREEQPPPAAAHPSPVRTALPR